MESPDGGTTRMEPSEIPPFGKLAFLADRFGMNWQSVAAVEIKPLEFEIVEDLSVVLNGI